MSDLAPATTPVDPPVAGLTSGQAALLRWYIDHRETGGFVPMEPKPVVTADPPSAQTIVMTHEKRTSLKCFCCSKGGCVSGLWKLTFAKGDQLVWMCAACGLAEAWTRWSGGYIRKNLLDNQLIATVTFK